MKKWIAAVIASLAVCGLAWLAGFDFNERGLGAFSVTIWALLAAIMTLSYPGWRE